MVKVPKNRLHSPPWGCPFHDDAMLFGQDGKLYCGICYEQDLMIDALEGAKAEIDKALRLLGRIE